MKSALIFVFSLAMGYLEAAVVVYLREIYYPKGFRVSKKIKFPFIRFGRVEELKPFSKRVFSVELGRELATVVMLAALAMLIGDSAATRAGYFLLAFGVWDISYYLFLKIITGWPESLSTTDILFLLPVPWIGPVWLPLLFSVTIIAVAVLTLL